MKKMSKIVSLAMAAALAAASLSMSASADGEDKIEIAITGGGEDSMQLNTATGSYLNGLSAMRHLYEGLYKLDANSEISLGQAASVDVSDDKLTWTFTLRDDITWSDGQPVTAQDFIYGFDNLAAQGGDYCTILSDVAESYEAPNDKTVVIKLKQPCAYLPSILAFSVHLSGKTGLCRTVRRCLCNRSGQICLQRTLRDGELGS